MRDMLTVAAATDLDVAFNDGEVTPSAAEINIKLAKVEPNRTPRPKPATPKNTKQLREEIDEFIVGLLKKHDNQESAQQ